MARLNAILGDLHSQFIELVKSRRGEKVNGDANVFSGEFWVAPRAQALGLIDGTAQLNDFLRARYGKDVRIKRMTPERGSLLSKVLSSQDAMKNSIIDPEALIEAGENRALWARYGL